MIKNISCLRLDHKTNINIINDILQNVHFVVSYRARS